MFGRFLELINNDLFPEVFKILVIVLPVVMPFLLFYIFWIIRLRWIQMKYIESQKNCLLEVKLPKELMKSPAAMEIFFSYLSQSGAGNLTEAYLDGRTRAWFSCEMVSIEGVVHFYVWCSQAKFKDIVEAQLYAQFPNVEIYEVKDDYTKSLYFDMEKYSMFGVQYGLAQPDVLPIKTYIDYGLDKDQKDEYKIDPITAVIEYLGTMRKGENVWIQILLRKHEKEGWKHGRLREKPDWKKDIDTKINEIRTSSMITTDGEESFKFPNPTKGQNEIIAALERSKSKVAFDCMVRSVYIAEKESFRPINIGGMIGSFRQYSSNMLNGFRPSFLTESSDGVKDLIRILPFLKEFAEKKVIKRKKKIFHAYKLRSFFEWPYKNLFRVRPFILTTEELATIFHFPSGMVSQTPTLTRVPSKKSEAPANLPI